MIRRAYAAGPLLTAHSHASITPATAPNLGKDRLMMLMAKARRGLVVYQLVLILLLIAIVLAILLYVRTHRATPPAAATHPAAPTRADTAPAGSLPVMAVKPTPREIMFDGCPPGGDGGDQELNRLKNRVDTGNYIPVSFDVVAHLPWPKSVERERMAGWPSSVRAAVDRYEGIPVVVEGYLAGAKVEEPESPNCHGADTKYHDWHIWLVGRPGEDRSTSVVIETTPRVRAEHPAWRISEVRQAVRDSDRVRVSGWLLLDPEHPDQVGKTRGTIWEIHPIMRMQVERGHRWVDLDSLTGGRRR